MFSLSIDSLDKKNHMHENPLSWVLAELQHIKQSEMWWHLCNGPYRLDVKKKKRQLKKHLMSSCISENYPVVRSISNNLAFFLTQTNRHTWLKTCLLGGQNLFKKKKDSLWKSIAVRVLIGGCNEQHHDTDTQKCELVPTFDVAKHSLKWSHPKLAAIIH